MARPKKSRPESHPDELTRKEIRRRLKSDKSHFDLFNQFITRKDSTLNDFQMLLDSGADLNPPKSDKSSMTGWTPLMSAAWNKRPELVAFFTAKGADIHYLSQDEESALSLSLYQDDQKSIQILRDAGADISQSKFLRSVSLGAAYRNEWEEVLKQAPETYRLNPDDWKVSYNFALALEKAGRYPEARALAENAKYAKKYENYFLDVLLRSALKAGDFKGAVKYWELAREEFIAYNTPADNFLANLLIVYINQSGPAQALAQVQPYLERALALSNKGLLEFNLSCTHALNGNINETVQFGLHAVSKGKLPSNFESESDFDGLRKHPYFIQFLKAANNDFLQNVYLTHPAGASVETELRMENHIINRWVKKSTHAPARPQQNVYSDEFTTLKAYNELLSNLKQNGYQETTPSYIKNWAATLDEYLNKLSENLSQPMGALILEWKPKLIESDHLIKEYGLYSLSSSTPEEIEKYLMDNSDQNSASLEFLAPRILGREAFQTIFDLTALSRVWQKLALDKELIVVQFEKNRGMDFWIKLKPNSETVNINPG